MPRPRLGLVRELKEDFPWDESPGVPRDVDSELLSAEEDRELTEGLVDAGWDVVLAGDAACLSENLPQWKSQCDLVFNKSVGYTGIDRKLLAACILEDAAIPYIGSAPYALRLTRNKYRAKLVVESAGVETPSSVLVTDHGNNGDLDALEYPVIVKPVAESSSIGITSRSKVDNPGDALGAAVDLVRSYGQPALVESFVEGYEIEVPMIDHPPLAVLGVIAFRQDGEYVEGGRFLTSESVYADDYELARPPEGLDVDRIARAAVRAATALGIRDYGRIDFRVARDGSPRFIEASTHPHIQRHSGFFAAASWQGLDYADLLRMILRAGARRCGLHM